MTISIEIGKSDEEKPEATYLVFDQEGLDLLRRCLSEDVMKKPFSQAIFKSPSWGGDQLSESAKIQGFETLPHFRLMWIE